MDMIPRAIVGGAVVGLAAVLAGGCSGEPGEQPAGAAPDSGRVAAGAPAAGAAPAAVPSTAPTADDAVHVLFGCMEGDSAVFADVPPDSLPGSAPAVRITLWHAGDGVDGSTVSAADGESVPVAAIRLVAHDSLMLATTPATNPVDTTVFVGRVACDSLWGTRRVGRQSRPADAVYRRLR